MLDAISAVKDQLHAPNFYNRYNADQAITTCEFTPVEGSHKLTVIFPPWHVPTWFVHRLTKQLTNQGSAVLSYTFNPMILSDNVTRVKTSFEYLALTIAEDVRELCNSHNLTTVNLFGISLGNVALCITAQKLDKFHEVTMLAPDSELAAPFWNGWRTRRLRDIIKREGYRLKDLQQEWCDLAPETHIELLKAHPVHVVLARFDRFIPYSYGRKLVNELADVDPRLSFTTSPYGHLYTILKYEYGL